MNINKMLHELYEDKQRLEKVIRSLEELRENPVDGQHSMGGSVDGSPCLLKNGWRFQPE
jgi:hypothetical protein